MQPSGTGEDPLQRLFHLLQDWRSLTLTETNLIHAADWQRLEQLQVQKTHLQKLIAESEAAFANSANYSAAEKTKSKARLREITTELVALETQNRALLADHLSRTDAQLKEANRTISSLRGIQNTYGKSHPSFWQAYS